MLQVRTRSLPFPVVMRLLRSGAEADSECYYRPYTNDDAPGSNTSPAGPNGEHKCDTPLSLEASMYEAINAVASDTAFALFTGDIVDDTTLETTQAYNTASSQSGPFPLGR